MSTSASIAGSVTPLAVAYAGYGAIGLSFVLWARGHRSVPNATDTGAGSKLRSPRTRAVRRGDWLTGHRVGRARLGRAPLQLRR